MTARDLTEGAVLEKRLVTSFPLDGDPRLPQGTSARPMPKALRGGWNSATRTNHRRWPRKSTGIARLPARCTTEICPRSFSVLVYAPVCGLEQKSGFFTGIDVRRATPCVRYPRIPRMVRCEALIDDGLGFSPSICACRYDACCYRAKPHTV